MGKTLGHMSEWVGARWRDEMGLPSRKGGHALDDWRRRRTTDAAPRENARIDDGGGHAQGAARYGYGAGIKEGAKVLSLEDAKKLETMEEKAAII